MSIFNNTNIHPHLMDSKSYKLEVKNSQNGTYIKMIMLTNYFHTNSLPLTHKVLKKNLPGVLATKCFNDSGLPFDSEVKNTEIGHLFEHIILEYLCQRKIKNGYKSASFRGVTNWNWRQDVRGTYHIEIDVKPQDIIYFEYALEESVKLLDKILPAN